MNLSDKIEEAIRVIDVVFMQYKKPCLFSSFGKDSMVLLHILKDNFSRSMPIIFFKQPFFQQKYAFANKIINDWELNVYSDIPPISHQLTKGKGLLEIVNHYPIGGNKSVLMPIGWIDPEGRKDFLCGRDDIWKRPLGFFEFPWDCALVGHKASDTDAVQGSIPLHVDIHQIDGSCHMAYPLRLFTDEDVWQYTEVNNLPIHTDRYEKVDGAWRTKPAKDFDPDYFPYCTKCLDRDGPIAVTCPINGLEITNIGPTLSYCDPKKELPYMGEKTN